MDDHMIIDTVNWGAPRSQNNNNGQIQKWGGRRGNQRGNRPAPPYQSDNNGQAQNGGGRRGNQRGNRTRFPHQWWQRGQQGQQGALGQQNQQGQQVQQPRLPLRCNNCPGKTNHTTEDCRKKIRAAKSEGFANSTPAFGFHNQQHNASAVSILYCPGCNSTDHDEVQCIDDRSLLRVRRSKFICTKCKVRGHTRDDCRNPLTARCVFCRNSSCKGQCKNEKVDVGEIFLGAANKASERFKWKLPPNWHLGPGQQARLDLARLHQDAQREGRSLPPETVHHAQAVIQKQEASLANWGGRPARTSDHLTQDFTLGPEEDFEFSAPDLKRQKHIERPHFMYHKHNANHDFRKYEQEIIKQGSLSENVLFVAKGIAAAGSNFWRDPKALEAIAWRMKPKCRTCGKDGVFLDENFSAIPPTVDILDVRDYQDWGVFILFHCQCCNRGFDYV